MWSTIRPNHFILLHGWNIWLVQRELHLLSVQSLSMSNVSWKNNVMKAITEIWTLVKNYMATLHNAFWFPLKAQQGRATSVHVQLQCFTASSAPLKSCNSRVPIHTLDFSCRHLKRCPDQWCWPQGNTSNSFMHGRNQSSMLRHCCLFLFLKHKALSTSATWSTWQTRKIFLIVL